MKRTNRLWITLILSLLSLTLLLSAASCDTLDKEDGSTANDTTETTAEPDVDLSALAPSERYEAVRRVTRAQPYAQLTVTGSVEMTDEGGEASTYPLSLILSRDGSLTHILMTDPDGHTREMTYSEGYLYWYENGERLRIQLNENRIAATVGALDYSFGDLPSGTGMEDYTHYVTEFPTVDSLFSTVTSEENREAASGQPAYTFAMSDAIRGKSGSFFSTDTLRSFSMTASALEDGRMSGMTLSGVWSLTEENTASCFYVLPILADTLGMEAERQGKYCAMTWELAVEFAYEAKELTAPEPAAEDIRLTWDEVMGDHHVIPFADITITYGTYERGVLPADIDQCIVSIRAKEGETLSRKDHILCWVIYRVENGEETRIVTYKGANRSTVNLEDEYWESHPAGNPSHSYLPLEPGEYKLVLHYIYTNKMGNTFEERWDIAGATTFRVMERDENA